MITDDTLREGLQTPGISYSIDEKLKLARLLSEAGIRRALVAYPSAHSSEFYAAKRIVESGFFPETFALGRTVPSDIDAICETGSNISLHLPFRLEKLDQVADAIRYASKKGRTLEVAVVDVIHHTDKEIMDLTRMVVDAGANVVQLPDTTGTGNPSRIRSIIRMVKSVFDVEVEVHCHNDFGGSVANTMAGLEAGADHVDTTVMGIGERNGIADMASMISILKSEGFDVGVNIEKLKRAYDYVMNLILDKIGTDFFLDNRPVFGKNTGINTAGTHAAYSDVFTGGGVSVNVYTGKAMIREILKTAGKQIPDEKLPLLVEAVKTESVETGRTVRVDRILKIAEEFL